MDSLNRPELLVTAADAGTANFLAAVLSRVSIPHIILAQEPAYSILTRRQYTPLFVDRSTSLNTIGQQLESHIRGKHAPRAVLCGTSWGITIDKAATLWARAHRRRCAAIIEHWTLYRERFSLVTNGHTKSSLEFLPQEVWVNDEIAGQEAVDSGLPAHLIRICGQPFLESRSLELRDTTPDMRFKNHILFVSERIADDFPSGTPAYRGYDEFERLGKLLDVAAELGRNVSVKLHPQDVPTKYNHLLKRHSETVLATGVPIDAILTSAHRIVGMESMLLIEAALVRSDVVSFLPEHASRLFIGNRLGLTTSISDTKTLATKISDALPRERTTDEMKFSGSSDRFLKMLGQLL